MAIYDYKHSPEECDVVDKAKLLAYRTRRQQWLRWLYGDKEHSIWNQVSSMMWNDSVFRLLNHARSYAIPSAPTASINGPLARFVDVGYVATQVLSISKLSDHSDDKSPKKGVVSIRRLLDDISTHRQLLTREIYVAHDGDPYDSQESERKYWEAFPRSGGSVLRGLPTSGPFAFASAERAHALFDKLADCAPEDRRRDQQISDGVLATLDAWLSAPEISRIRALRNKFIAHAADEKSRSSAALDRLGVSLHEIDTAHEMLLRVGNAIDSTLLFHSSRGTAVPTPQFDILEHMDAVLVPNAQLGDLSGEWKRHIETTDSWLKKRFNLVTGELL